MADPILDTVLLFALPASGKSEVRKYMASLSPEQVRRDLCMGPTLQLDDYPYVHLMHRIDDELRAAGWKELFYKGPQRPFQDDWEWAVLIELLNEDYDDLLNRRTAKVSSAAELLFDRLDRAHLKVGLRDVMGDIPHRIRRTIGAALEPECATELEVKNQTCGQDRAGKTIIIEAARGGPNGAAFPLTPPVGYQATFQQLSLQILERASVLYVWVDPEESRRKNLERGRPDGQGSILHHSVPMEVMVGQYGCDDMDYLIKQSDRPDTVKVDRIAEETAQDGSRHYASRTFYVPIARFDNRKDKTSFIREDKAQWNKADVKAIHEGLGSALTLLAKAPRGAA